MASTKKQFEADNAILQKQFPRGTGLHRWLHLPSVLFINERDKAGSGKARAIDTQCLPRIGNLDFVYSQSTSGLDKIPREAGGIGSRPLWFDGLRMTLRQAQGERGVSSGLVYQYGDNVIQPRSDNIVQPLMVIMLFSHSVTMLFSHSVTMLFSRSW